MNDDEDNRIYIKLKRVQIAWQTVLSQRNPPLSVLLVCAVRDVRQRLRLAAHHV